MARMRRVLATARAALRAAVTPIETWSSLLAEVGIESTLARMGQGLVLGGEGGRRHVRDHEPRLQAAVVGEERRAGRRAWGSPGARCAAR